MLWIGYLQWHFRTHGRVNPPEPVIKNFKNIQCRDAVLDWTSKQPELDQHGKPVTRWDGRTTKPHPVTGEEVPNETARTLSFRYLNPKKAEWPEADFIVGDPPFIGDRVMRATLGNGYVAALRSTYSDLSGSCDYVVYWWHKAAKAVRAGQTRQFGFMATNSLRQNLNRRAIQEHLNGQPPLSIVFAIADHPWIDAAAGASVRISMTIGVAGSREGHLHRIKHERDGEEAAKLLMLSSKAELDAYVPILQLGQIRPVASL